MSKSLGNVVSPHEVLKTFHPDVIRYYMMKEGGQERDGNWSQSSLRNRYTYLCNTWGNLISRMMSPKMDLQIAILNVFENGVYRGIYSLQPEQDEHLRNAIESATDVYRYCMNNLNFEGALNVLDNLWRAVQYLLILADTREINMSRRLNHGCIIPQTQRDYDFIQFNIKLVK